VSSVVNTKQPQPNHGSSDVTSITCTTGRWRAIRLGLDGICKLCWLLCYWCVCGRVRTGILVIAATCAVCVQTSVERLFRSSTCPHTQHMHARASVCTFISQFYMRTHICCTHAGHLCLIWFHINLFWVQPVIIDRHDAEHAWDDFSVSCMPTQYTGYHVCNWPAMCAPIINLYTCTSQAWHTIADTAVLYHFATARPPRTI
jgi:hypothetical protein